VQAVSLQIWLLSTVGEASAATAMLVPQTVRTCSAQHGTLVASAGVQEAKPPFNVDKKTPYIMLIDRGPGETS
jgi:hypothetical protein